MKKTLCFLAACLVIGCTETNVKPQEPIAPQSDTTAYPEDPQLVQPDAPAEVPDPSDFDADTGALTDDPFGPPKNIPRMEDKSDDTLKDVPETPADQLNIPTDEALDAAAKTNQPQYNKSQKATPSIPAPPPPAPKYPDKKKKKKAGG